VFYPAKKASRRLTAKCHLAAIGDRYRRRPDAGNGKFKTIHQQYDEKLFRKHHF